MKKIAHGVYLRDLTSQVEALLPSKFQQRDIGEVVRLFVHHSGANGEAGVRGALNSVRFVVRVRGWSSPGYHLWIPREPEADKVEVYQLTPFNAYANHTKGRRPSREGVGLVVQGNTTARAMTNHQLEALEAIIPWVQEKVLRPCPEGEDWLSWHSESDRYGGTNPKKSCPGVGLQNWLEEYRELIPLADKMERSGTP